MFTIIKLNKSIKYKKAEASDVFCFCLYLGLQFLKLHFRFPSISFPNLIFFQLRVMTQKGCLVKAKKLQVLGLKNICIKV